MGDMYSMLNAFNRTRHSIFLIPESVRGAIRLWRAHLFWAEIQTVRGAPRGRSLESFDLRPPILVLEMDGSLTGLGCRLFTRDPHSGSERLLGHMKATLVDDLGGDSSYQNTMELLAVVWGLAGLGQLGYQNCGVRIRGDSDTVLHWTSSTRGSFGSILA